MILIKISGSKAAWFNGILSKFCQDWEDVPSWAGAWGGWWLCKVCCCCSLDPVSTHLAAYLKGHTLHPFDSTVKNQEKIAF